MDDLLAEFIAETREMLETISGEIVAWEADPGDRDRLDAIFRFVHTVKGSCGFLDLPRLQTLSHEAESALAALREGRRRACPELVSAILAVIDRIGDMADALERGEDIGDGDDAGLIAALAGSDEGADGAGPVVTGESRHIARPHPVRSIRVPVELLDRLMGGVSDLVLARNELSRQLRRISGEHELDMAFDRISSCVADMRDAITWTRMQRIEGLFAALPRLVRDLSADLGKAVSLEVEGADVELDREMIEMLRDPLTHIVRNALDHGIEAPDERRDLGKGLNGALRVSARQSGNQIQIEIADDGRGIDVEGLIDRAVATDCIDRAAANQLTEQQALELIFHPGLSTATTVSPVSGRGVGMDVVRSNVERIGGTIEIATRPGQGTIFKLCVPLTLTIIPALIVGVQAELFAVPRSTIDEIVSLGRGTARIETVGGADVVVLRGARIPVVRLAHIFEFEEAGDEAAETIVILHSSRGERFALAVSQVFDHEELVVKPAAPGVMASGVYAGTALPDNGRPLLLLDTAGIAAKAGLHLTLAQDGDDGKQADRRREKGIDALVFTDLDGVRRAISMGIVERIIEADAGDISENAGMLRFVSGDEIIPVAAMGALPRTGTLKMLRLSDGVTEIAYAIAGPADVARLPQHFEPASRPGRVAGVAVLGGAPVELLDTHFLFAEFDSAAPSSAERPTCRIEGSDDRWAREVLRPLVEAAGYRVVMGDDAGAAEADIVIQADDTQSDPVPDAGEVVRLSAAPEAGDGRLYRYDRAGIFNALRTRLRAGG